MVEDLLYPSSFCRAGYGLGVLAIQEEHPKLGQAYCRVGPKQYWDG